MAWYWGPYLAVWLFVSILSVQHCWHRSCCRVLFALLECSMWCCKSTNNFHMTFILYCLCILSSHTICSLEGSTFFFYPLFIPRTWIWITIFQNIAILRALAIKEENLKHVRWHHGSKLPEDWNVSITSGKVATRTEPRRWWWMPHRHLTQVRTKYHADKNKMVIPQQHNTYHAYPLHFNIKTMCNGKA